MLLKGTEFLERIGGLGLLMDKSANGKCIEDCEECLISRMKDAMKAEYEVVYHLREKGVLSEKELRTVMLELVQCNNLLNRDFGCSFSCADDICDYEWFTTSANATPDNIIKFPGVTLC
jgi:hypothetical protein